MMGGWMEGGREGGKEGGREGGMECKVMSTAYAGISLDNHVHKDEVLT
jgi:hypothetical protein